MSSHLTKIDNVPDSSSAEAHAGMAYFADTGPFGTTCGDCAHRGYPRVSDRWSKDRQRWETVTRKHNGCELFRRFTGRYGPPVDPSWASCKYFDRREEGAT